LPIKRLPYHGDDFFLLGRIRGDDSLSYQFLEGQVNEAILSAMLGYQFLRDASRFDAGVSNWRVSIIAALAIVLHEEGR
jgi:hypothetical protein